MGAPPHFPGTRHTGNFGNVFWLTVTRTVVRPSYLVEAGVPIVDISLTDRNYLVTGAGSGIGAGVAEAIAAAGGNVILLGRNAEKLAAAADG